MRHMCSAVGLSRLHVMTSVRIRTIVLNLVYAIYSCKLYLVSLCKWGYLTVKRECRIGSLPRRGNSAQVGTHQGTRKQ